MTILEYLLYHQISIKLYNVSYFVVNMLIYVCEYFQDITQYIANDIKHLIKIAQTLGQFFEPL
jgi:hypothetical protein